MKKVDSGLAEIMILVISSIVGMVSLILLLFSFFAALTESHLMPISESLYAILRSFCHQLPSRSMWYANSSFGVCSHCFGILLGALIASVFFIISYKNPNTKSSSMRFAGCVFLVGLSVLLLEVYVDQIRSGLNAHWIRIAAGLFASSSFVFLAITAFYKLNNMFKSREVQV